MSDQKSTVVIPCAGKGTRLYPLTKNLSKSLVKIGNYKMIDYAISECILGNIDRIVFIISPEDEQLKDHISCINNKKMPGLKKNEYVDTDIKIVEQKKKLILSIFDKTEKKNDRPNEEKVYRTTIADEVAEKLDVDTNRKFVRRTLEKARKSEINKKLNKPR